jgi:DNA topoisomerase-3
VKLPRGLKSHGAICRAFLDQHAPARSLGSGEHRPQNGPRPPSEAMVRYAQALAEEQGIECPPEITTDFAACRAFLDEHASRKATKSSARNGAAIRKGRSPATNLNRSDGHPKAHASKQPTATKAGAMRGRTRARSANPAQPSR